MYENITYDQLKDLPDEEKKEALIYLKEKYPTYKEMSQAIGGIPLSLSHLYMRVVEGKTFGRKKKEEAPSEEKQVLNETQDQQKDENDKPSDTPALSTSTMKKKRGSKKKETEIITPQKEQSVAPKKDFSFTIGLEVEVSGEEAKTRMEGVMASLLKDKNYKVKLSIEEV